MVLNLSEGLGRTAWRTLRLVRRFVLVARGKDSRSGVETNNCTVFVSVIVPDGRLLQRTPEYKPFWQAPKSLANGLGKFDEPLSKGADLVANRTFVAKQLLDARGELGQPVELPGFDVVPSLKVLVFFCSPVA